MAWFLKKYSACLLALAISLGGNVSFAATAQDAVNACKGFPDVEWPRNCQSYFLTILEIIESDDPALNPDGPLCVDQDVPLSEIISKVIVWIENNPSQNGISVFNATHRALSPDSRCD